ncbi:YfdQ family protein [Crossiella sp. SN42]|uniref:DUF2303 family protein n=1 Tax=Crossiella sp. SN42 TaxID=2944808 RepID=UPI00207C9D62|nr:DUF2303 family protein [Crossiella sp. SN42]MCO1574998.1 YfdQ family protein [Crossiella sp. SN42]
MNPYDDEHTAASGTEAAAALGRLTTKVEPYVLTPDTSIVVTRIRHDERVVVTDLENHLTEPVAPRGQALLREHKHFAAYVNRLAKPASTTLWAERTAATVTAILDDHVSHVTAGWREHRVVLDLVHDLDWKTWQKYDGKLLSQHELADLLESLAHTVVSPDAATMIEVATSFRAKRNVSFDSAVRLDSGDTQLTYAEETTATAGRKGNIEVPSQFLLRLPVFEGSEPADLLARLRYRIDGGRLYIGYALHRPDVVVTAAFERVLAEIHKDCPDLPMLMGTAPDPLRSTERK